MKKFNPLPYILIFLTTFLILQTFQGSRNNEEPILNESAIHIEANKNSYAIGKDVKIKITNNTGSDIEVEHCNEPALDTLKYSSEGFSPVTYESADCKVTEVLTLKPGNTTVSLLDYSYTLFGEVGRYKVAFSHNDVNYESPEFEIRKPGILTQAWRTGIYNPILNALVWLIIVLPGHQLGLAVIVLTLSIRTLLLVPSIKAIRAQKNMQLVQPKLEALKKKYEGDQAKLAQETMLLWKKHKVHPLSSCLPMLIQFPILIALFYVIRGGLSPDKAVLIYDFLPSFDLANINPMFLSFDLLERSLIIFPVTIGLLQFAQMQLMVGKQKKKGSAGMPKEMESANKMMRYMMPVMIAFFTSQLPAAVGLYWGTSTFYGVIQQLMVNKEGSSTSAEVTSDDDVKVRVINKSKKSSK
jgi:YidC/Oxa1 family membrane protein insertase